MSAEVAEAIRQTRRTLAEKTWVPHFPDWNSGECCLGSAIPPLSLSKWKPVAAALCETLDLSPQTGFVPWNDRQTDVGAVLGMALQALIAELCKPTLAPRTAEA